MNLSWVTIDRVCEDAMRSDGTVGGLLAASGRPLRSNAVGLSDEELLAKLRGFGLDMNRRDIDQLCAGALSVEAVAASLIDRCDFVDEDERMEGDWIWICLVTLWQRWWPDRVCLELLDDKIQAGYRELEHDGAAAAATWLDAWSDVLLLCDAVGIATIEQFDDRFPMTQSLYNWSQDLEDALWNAGLDDEAILRARIDVCAEALRRFPDEDQLVIENRRRSLAESHFEMGHTDQAEDLFASWLAADPAWGFGWIGWASCHQPRRGRPGDPGRVEELLRRGYSAPGVRDRDAIAEWLQSLFEESGRLREARDFRQQVRRLRHHEPTMTASRTLQLADRDDGTEMLRDTVTAEFDGDGVSLDQLPDILRAAKAPGTQRRSTKIGRNAACPCGSGKKYKRCCGAPGSPGGSDTDRDAGPGNG